MENIFLEVAVILCTASVLSIVFRLLKQPPILAYILTGILIGPLAGVTLESQEALKTMGEFGITLLLFMLGLELKLKDLYRIGKLAVILGSSQVIFTGILGYFIALGLGFSQVASLYIGIALTFSSTIIIVKLLSDKKDLNSLFGKISVGLLLAQDFFAIGILIFLSSFQSADSSPLTFSAILLVLSKGVLLFAVVLLLSRHVFPWLLGKIAQSLEMLFLFSIAWVFGLAALVSSPLIGFSIEIGGFLAGVALANSVAHYQIVAKARALRDFFIVIFFVMLGLSIHVENLLASILPIVTFSYFVLLSKPLIIIAIMGILGYRKRTSFLTGIHAAQISEFSLIILFLGNKLGHIDANIVTIITGVGIITFVASTYMIGNAHALYKFFQPYLWMFERQHAKKESFGVDRAALEHMKDHVVLVGAHRMGISILDALLDTSEEVIVVDFDPDIVTLLQEKGILSLYGDIADIDIQEKAKLDKATLVISTVPDIEDNLLLIRGLNQTNGRSKIIVVANEVAEAKILYRAGANYVALPHISGGKQIAKLLRSEHLEKLEDLKKRDLRYFEEVMEK